MIPLHEMLAFLREHRMGDRDGYTHIHIPHRERWYLAAFGDFFCWVRSMVFVEMVRRYRHTEREYNYLRGRHRPNSNLP
jgi:hypothetical protein